jgi:capsular exopolysaccharide synthesis family protein
LLQRYNESGLEERDQANNIRMLDPARGAAVLAPNQRRTGIIGFAMGLMLGLGLAFFIEFLDRSVKSQDDIESTIGLPFLGMVPTAEDLGSNGAVKDLHIVRHPNSTAAECCRVVRTNILFASPDKPLKTLIITSSNPVEGKTTTVVNLGIAMAQSGHRTLIVDTDMRRPRLHKVLGTSNENGVSRLIVGEAEIESAVKSTDVPGLFLLPCGPIPPNPAELLQTERFSALARKLADRFDRVIFDSPPTLAVTDAAVLSRVTDGCVLVVRAGRTSRDALVRAKQSIASAGTRIVGVVLNDVDLKKPQYSAYYSSYHYKYHDVSPATGNNPPPA